MTWLEFFSSIASSLAWPTVAIVALVLFKEQLVEAIPRLQRIKYKELEAEFDRGLEKIEHEIKGSDLGDIQDEEVAQDFEQNLLQISEISPNAAIVEAFRQIEQSSKALIKARGTRVDYKVAAPYRLIEKLLDSSGVLNKREIKIFRDLRLLRNKITHGETYFATPEQAKEYIALASALIGKIDALSQEYANNNLQEG
ncbi:hypothetical protein [Ruegeria sp. HKCCSP346]|uniref:hypothetical protein n=1 Tax=Ruegeria sp. HKCCSP346 TaxID=2794830 RepID=UPI001AEAB2BB|nr:hypothetical protein [Ruegeria sp. HKCCSP346]